MRSHIEIISAKRDAPRAVQQSDRDMVTLRTSQLRPGVKLQSPVYDSRNVLLLAPGATITTTVIERLEQRGVMTIKVDRREVSRICRSQPSGGERAQLPSGLRKQALRSQTGIVCPLVTRHSSRLDAGIDQGRMPALSSAGPAFAEEIAQHGATKYNAELAHQMIESHEQSLDQMASLFKSLDGFKSIEAGAAEAVSADNLVRMAADLDLFVSLGITPATDKYPARHGMQTSMLAMAIGTSMGLDRRSILDMGMGCLVHDAGMLQINRKVFQSESSVDPLGFIEITKHPILTFDMMRDVEDLPGCARLVAYQVHERCDGSGYPRRRKAGQIHQLAKIAAVADVFVALVSPRPHRQGMMPYYAIEHLIRGTKTGQFDPQVVRALLRTTSLFPVGSFVELSDGRQARVIRSSGATYTQPIVEVWERGQFNMQPSIVDLSGDTELAIERPLPVLIRPADAVPADDWD